MTTTPEMAFAPNVPSVSSTETANPKIKNHRTAQGIPGIIKRIVIIGVISRIDRCCNIGVCRRGLSRVGIILRCRPLSRHLNRGGILLWSILSRR
jgi:hypothetical protein